MDQKYCILQNKILSTRGLRRHDRVRGLPPAFLEHWCLVLRRSWASHHLQAQREDVSTHAGRNYRDPLFTPSATTVVAAREHHLWKSEVNLCYNESCGGRTGEDPRRFAADAALGPLYPSS